MAFACCLNVYGECAHEQHVRRTLTLTLTLTHTIAAYSVIGNVVRMPRILICAPRQKQCRKSLPTSTFDNVEDLALSQEEQDTQLSQRDRAAGCVIVFAKSRRLELEDNILRTL